MYYILWIVHDLGFSIYFLSHFSNNPKRDGWKFVKSILQYRKGILNFELKNEKCIEKRRLTLC